MLLLQRSVLTGKLQIGLPHDIELIQDLIQVGVGLSQAQQGRPQPQVCLSKWCSDVACRLAAPTAGKISVVLPGDVIEVAVTVDHQRLSSSILDGGCTCESCNDGTVDVAHLSPFMDVHFYLSEAGVVGVGPMLRLVLNSAPGVVAVYKGEKLWVVVGITLQIIVDLCAPPLS